MKTNTKSTDKEPRIYKTEDYRAMLDLIDSGVWRTVNLVNALHIDKVTVIKWRKTKKARMAHRKAIMKFVKRRTDPEKILKELMFDIETEKQESKQPLVIIKDGDKTITVADRSMG